MPQMPAIAWQRAVGFCTPSWAERAGNAYLILTVTFAEPPFTSEVPL